MTHYELNGYLIGTILVCCAMSIVMAIKNWNRGWKGLILSVSYLVFGATIYLFKSGAPQMDVVIGVTILMLLLLLDLFFRAGAKPAGKKR